MINKMSTRGTYDVTPLFPDKEDSSAATGWDPYIFTLMSDVNRMYSEERRRTPRPLTAARRRALLIAKLK
jgi:hypothetical protein